MRTQDRKDRCYRLSYVDKKGNELFYTFRWCQNLIYAKQLAKVLQANSMLNDLHKINVTCGWK